MACNIFLCSSILSGQEINSLDDGRTIKIPILFHIIYGNEKQNIADSLIINELRDLNLDFSKRNDMSLLDNEFRNLVGNPNIEFYLLDKSFQENGIKGINRISAKNTIERDKKLIDPINCVMDKEDRV